MKFTIAYTLLFLYVISAIVFWGYSLHKQNVIVTKLELEVLSMKHLDPNSIDFQTEVKKIDDKKSRRVKQYWGEGTTFLFVIMLAAGIVYFSYYRQLQLSKLQKNFMLSVTHELKTPIAGIKLNMQTLEKRKLDEETQQKLVKSSVLETNRLNDLCNNILIATQLEDNKKAIYADDIHVQELIKEQVNEIKSRYPLTHFELDLKSEAFILKGDTMMWKLVISNLLENARKYSPKEEPISIVLKTENNKTFMSVSDLGIGISDDEKKRIFEKFYRIGNENTRNTKGTGLGLYIVKKIVGLYKYDITVRNNTPNGSIFEVAFS